MQRFAQTFGVLCAVMMLGATAQAKDSFDFKSESFDLPTGERMFTGPGADPVNNNCLTCHSAGMVTVQPRLSKATWEGIVKKMINVYKAPVPDADVAPIVDYLSNHSSAGK
ncbi:cytochrome c [Hyphomicrobium sp. B1]|uniref:c-type cytochrome n=1 Tax=Hyphomicrobium sp. B1 TaxID=3075651 RepID=UPI003C2B83A7